MIKKLKLEGDSARARDLPVESTSKSVGSSRIQLNIFIWVLLRVQCGSGWQALRLARVPSQFALWVGCTSFSSLRYGPRSTRKPWARPLIMMFGPWLINMFKSWLIRNGPWPGLATQTPGPPARVATARHLEPCHTRYQRFLRYCSLQCRSFILYRIHNLQYQIISFDIEDAKRLWYQRIWYWR